MQATLLHEDRYFGDIRASIPVAVLRATWHCRPRGHARGGASTITMQFARLRPIWQTRVRCAASSPQMLRALEFERHYSKAQILEAYLNLAPYGRNIEGVGAASEIYFGKNRRSSTWHEAVALSVMPQSPTRRAPAAEVMRTRSSRRANRLVRSPHGRR